jgi:hypothetical protein
MKPTKILNLIGVAAVVSVVGYFLIQLMIGNGLPTPTMELNVVLVQPAIALILFLSALPMVRYKRALKKLEAGKGSRPAPVDSRYAVRTLAFAKSVSITGSIFVGWQFALLTHQLLGPANQAALGTFFALAGAASMAVVGLIVENLFRVPPDKNSGKA